MSLSGLGTSHLQQTKLSDEAVDLLLLLGTWLSDLKFAPYAEGFETLAHPQLHEKIKDLLTELGLLNKVPRYINTLDFG
jgi:hypothetical protein